MKQKIKISNGTKTIYYGKAINIPVTEDSIIQKSIELFDDDEPCIIHQSYVQKEFADILLNLLKGSPNKEINLIDFKAELYFLRVSNVESVKIVLEGWLYGYLFR
mgnify:CR=1 FL=1